MRIKEREEEFGKKTSDAKLTKFHTSDGVTSYHGEINTFDGFFDKKPIKFNIQADQTFCDHIGRAMVLFRFSPQSQGSQVWDHLNEVKLPNDICN